MNLRDVDATVIACVSRFGRYPIKFVSATRASDGGCSWVVSWLVYVATQHNPPLLLLKWLKAGVGMLESVPIDNRFAAVGMLQSLLCQRISSGSIAAHFLVLVT